MTFNSLTYILSLPIVYLIFYGTADRWRWLVLLTASYGFYASLNAPYLLVVLLLVTSVSFYCALRMAATRDDAFCKRWLWIGCFACVAILALMKYLPLRAAQSAGIFGLNSSLSAVVTNVGVSYYTFQAISYLADVYLEIHEPERHFGYYALYLAFFPKLLQGPIERAGDLLPQLKLPYRFDYDTMRSGMLLFTWGLFKKVVIADRLAVMVNSVYGNVHAYKGVSLILATYYFALQIYFDFSGYTDMALGTARLFNIRLTQNFNNPYGAASIPVFWRRWHISFSRWILDYIFKPLQMFLRKMGKWGMAIALLLTFLVSGVWHGVSLGFVVWGLLHGTYLVVAVTVAPFRKRLYARLGLLDSKVLKGVEIFVTFNLVCIAWIFFRAANFPDAWYVCRNMANLDHYHVGLGGSIVSFIDYAALGLYWPEFAVLSVLVAAAMMVEFMRSRVCLFDKPLWVRWPAYMTLTLGTISLYYVNTAGFLYAKF